MALQSVLACSEGEAPPLVAGRFELVAPLSRGGMGEVFLARERVSGERVALKRLRIDLADRAHMVNLFRAEYQALARLKHPRIIKVYEFGVDAGLPFYTMELLDGRDLAQLPRTPYQKACSYLRDVASSLALLHAQRLLHRDLSPRNVRLSSDDRCKLLDFGTMIPFGVPPDCAGTAPLVPPEAAECADLDQRADLYSLGALAYWLLTGKHAYPAQKMGELLSLWQRPVTRPRAWVPEIPEALDALVMSLLELTPHKRPATAEEVIEQLNAIAQLAPEEDVEVAQGYLASSPLCGRKAEGKRLRGLVRRAAEGHGAAVLITGPRGIGKTRLLHELGIYGQTRGMLSLRGHGGGEQSGGSLVQQLVRGLTRMAPELVTLAPSVPPPSRKSSPPRVSGRKLVPRRVSVELLGVEERAKEQAQLNQEFTRVARERPLLIVIDDLDRADEYSVSFIASLAHQARSLPLLIVATVSAGHATPASAAVSGFESCAETLTLGSLDADSVRTLVAGMVGEVPNLARLVDWLERAARGNPGLIVELIQLLVHKGLLSYQDGGWVLPAGEIREPIPRDLAETLAHRLSPLGPQARTIAEVASLLRRDATPELCMLAAGSSLSDTLDALGELVAAGILVSAHEGYAFAQGALREAVQSRLSDARKREIHRQLGHALLALPESIENRVEAGDQLIDTDEELFGADLIADSAPRMLAEGRDWGLALAAMERALAVYERRGAPYCKILPLRQQLVLAGYLFDYRLALAHGDDTLAKISSLGVFARLERWSRWLGPTIALGLALVLFVLCQPFSRVMRGTPNVYALLILFGHAAMGLMGVRATSLDRQGTRRVAERVAAFGGLWITGMYSVHKACQALALQSQGREAKLAHAVAAARQTLRWRRLGMNETDRKDLDVGLMLAGGVNECYRRGSQALARADELEAVGTQLAVAAAHRIRMTYHVVRGERERSEHYRKLIELHGLRGGTTWQVEWFAVPIDGMASSRYGDVVGTRRALVRLEELAEELPALAPLRDMVRIGYRARRGDLEAATLLGEQFMKDYPPHSTIGWGNAYADIAGAYNRLGQHERAREICVQALSATEPGDREYIVMYGTLELEWAIASACLGDAAGHAYLNQERARLEEAGEMGLLVVLHEGFVTLAALQGDAAVFQDALQGLHAAAERTGQASLIAHAARIAQAHQRRAPGITDSESGLDLASDVATTLEGSRHARSTETSERSSETPISFESEPSGRR